MPKVERTDHRVVEEEIDVYICVECGGEFESDEHVNVEVLNPYLGVDINWEEVPNGVNGEIYAPLEEPVFEYICNSCAESKYDTEIESKPVEEQEETHGAFHRIWEIVMG